MVNEVVSIKRPFNWPGFFLVFGGGIVILLVLYFVFFLGSVFGNNYSIGSTVENPLVELLSRYEQQGINMSNYEVVEQAEKEFDLEYINYVLYSMSAYKLHNPPFSGETPKIMVILDGADIYYSEVIDSEIYTYKESVGESDISVISNKKEIINAMFAEKMSDFMSNSVRDGKTTIELIAGNIKLASKGYLQMYGDITGESLI